MKMKMPMMNPQKTNPTWKLQKKDDSNIVEEDDTEEGD